MKLQKLVPFTFILVLFNFIMNAQVGIGTTTPDTSSVLDVTSTTQGVLVPRMTSNQRTSINTPAEGLLVFDINQKTFYFHDGSSWVRLINENRVNDYTGWADYVDGTYTSLNPFLLTANDKVILPNDATTKRDSQKPIDVAEFYNSTNSTITGRDGDGLNIVIEFKVRPTANQTTKITVAIDIGGVVGEIYTRDFITSKGIDVEHYYLSSFNAYTLNTWEANGGTIKIVSDYDAEVYDIRYVLTRTHKAR